MIKLCSYIYKHPDGAIIEWWTLIQGNKAVRSYRSIEELLRCVSTYQLFSIEIDPYINYNMISEYESIKDFISDYPEYQI